MAPGREPPLVAPGGGERAGPSLPLGREDRHRTPRLGVYSRLALLCVLLAVATGQPELIALGAPFAVFTVVSLAMGHGRIDHVRIDVGDDRIIVDDIVEVTISGTATANVSELSITPSVTGLHPLGDHSTVLTPGGDGSFRAEFRFRADHWGEAGVGSVTIDASDWLGAFRATSEVDHRATVRVHPRTEQLRALATPRRTGVGTGMHLSPRRGEGIEFADIRPFTTGDRLGAINWRVTARRQEPWVNDQHPDRSADVVLFLDTFEALDGDSGLRLAVEAASALARRHGAVADRVGLVELGGVFRWIRPGAGADHLHQIVDALLNTQAFVTEADKTIDLVPIKALPPRSTIIALTPLLDDRGVTALFDLLGRRHDLVVVETAIDRFIDPAVLDANPVATALWRLDREELRLRLQGRGARVISWSAEEPFDRVLHALAPPGQARHR